MNIQELYRLYQKYPRVVTDSRKIIPGSIFFALKGDKYNGNLFAGEALRKGSAFVVVDDESVISDSRYILVPDSLEALQELAKVHRMALKTKVIAVTGSNGKTTTKELLRDVLKRKYPVTATEGNLNNHIGVPLTVLNLSTDDAFAIVEMGASHTGEIGRLCKIANPGCGLITNIGRAHIEGFGGLNGVMKTKGELYHYLGSIRGTVFVDSGNILLVEMLKNFNGEIIQYGQGKKSLCSGKIINNFPAITVQINIQGDKEEKYTFPTKLSGGYNLENILAAFCVGLHFNVPGFEMADAVSSYSPGLMRSQLIHTRNNTIIMDAYNANPTSMDAAIQDFAADPDPDKLLVLGEMKELGDTAVEEHRHLIGMISDLGFRDVILIGQLFSQEGFPGYFRFFKKTGDCMDWLQNHPVNGKKILIKGSRLMELEKLMPYL